MLTPLSPTDHNNHDWLFPQDSNTHHSEEQQDVRFRSSFTPPSPIYGDSSIDEAYASGSSAGKLPSVDEELPFMQIPEATLGNDLGLMEKQRKRAKKGSSANAQRVEHGASSCDASSQQQHDVEDASNKLVQVCSIKELIEKEYGYWTVLSRDPSLVKPIDKCPPRDSLFISIRTRTDPDTAFLMKKMYSSLRYSLVIKLKQSLFSQLALDTAGDLKVECHIVYAESIHRLAKNSRTGEHLIQIDNLTPLLQKKADTFETKQKISFSDVSYHHKNSPFRLRVKVFHTGVSHTQEILTMVSGPFMLFARRPKKEVKSARKRKKPGNPTLTEPASKRRKQLFSSLKHDTSDEKASLKEAVLEKTTSDNVSKALNLIDELSTFKKQCTTKQWAPVSSKLKDLLES